MSSIVTPPINYQSAVKASLYYIYLLNKEIPWNSSNISLKLNLLKYLMIIYKIIRQPNDCLKWNHWAVLVEKN